MTTALPDVDVSTWLSEEQQDELQPPCEGMTRAPRSQCGHVAEWACRIRCPGCERRAIVLQCEFHKECLVAEVLVCKVCDSPFYRLEPLSVERL